MKVLVEHFGTCSQRINMHAHVAGKLVCFIKSMAEHFATLGFGRRTRDKHVLRRYCLTVGRSIWERVTRAMSMCECVCVCVYRLVGMAQPRGSNEDCNA